MSSPVVPFRRPAARPAPTTRPAPDASREPLWRHAVGEALRTERLGQHRTLKDVADAARISVPYLSELERGRKEASSEILAAASRALGMGLADLVDAALTRLAPVPAPVAERGVRRHEVFNLAA